ncbi:hypothetical protein RRG08_059762 [Elysia crispata]|uniref:Uncharacterized protein n=1 Tax=Elysia crispata TaxID=231223 RepID=A0AAE1EDU9_9GAST|nr:hypothetical protein RRG08_059762 [Elysia crispata]
MQGTEANNNSRTKSGEPAVSLRPTVAPFSTSALSADLSTHRGHPEQVLLEQGSLPPERRITAGLIEASVVTACPHLGTTPILHHGSSVWRDSRWLADLDLYNQME